MKITYSPEVERQIQQSKAKLERELEKENNISKRPEKKLDCDKLSTNKKQYAKKHKELGL